MKLVFRFSLTLVMLLSIFMNISFSQDVTFFSPQYFSVSENSFDPIRHLEYEPIIFEICTDEGNIENMKSELSCQSSNSQKIEVDMNQFSNSNCYYGYVEENICEKSELKVSYLKDNDNRVYTRNLQETKESNVVDFVLSNDYEDIDDPVELSYYLIVHNKIKGMNDESQKIYQRLRDMRDNDEKCWPSNDCDILDTSLILYNLKIAGYEKNRRLIEDGRIYLNSDKTLINGTIGEAEFEVNLSFNVAPSPDVNCSIYVDDELEDNITLDNNDIYELNENVESTFNISCDDNVDTINISVVDEYGEEFSTQLNTESEYNYLRNELFCYGDSTSCELTPTLYSLLSYEKDLTYYTELIDYINVFKKNISSNQQYIDERDDTIKSSLYFSLLDDETIANHIKFKQNNDGSWGDDNRNNRRIYETYTSIESLSNSNNAQEYIKDGEEWMYFNEPRAGWGNIEKNSQAYLSIERFIRPFLILDEYSQLINSSNDFSIKNPSIFEIQDVKVEIDEEFEQYISYTKDLEDILPDESVEFNISTQGVIPVEKKITLSISGVINGKREEFIEAPIILSSEESISIETQRVEFSEVESDLNIRVENKIPNSEVKCEYSNSFNSDTGTINLNNKNSNKLSTLSIDNSELKTGDMELKLLCNYEGDSIEINESIKITKKEPTFEVLDNSTSMLLIEDFNNFELDILSSTNENQNLTISFTGGFQGVVNLEESIPTLRPRDRRSISFNQLDDEELLNTLSNSTGSIRISSSLGYSENVEFEFKNNPQSSNLLIYILAGVVGFVILISGLVIYRFIEMKQTGPNQNNHSSAAVGDDEMLDLDELDFN